MTWVVRGLALFGVSVLSGLLWLALKPGSPEQNPDDQANAAPPPGKYDFRPIQREEGYQGCEDVSNGQIRDFFAQRQCGHLTRALYQTTLPTGDKVLTSVITVLMPDPASAAQLNDKTTKDNTGNVSDLVDSKRDGTEGFPRLSDDGYFSEQQDRLVVIGDSAYFSKPGPKGNKTDPVLVDVTRDALRLGWPQDKDKAPR